jgi:hypothetical protein
MRLPLIRAVGLGGVEVSLGPAGGAPGDIAAVAPTETTPPVETAETPPEIAPTEATLVEAARPVEPEAVIPVETVETPPPPAEVEPPEQVVQAKPEIVETLPEPAPPETVVAEEPPAEQTAATARGAIYDYRRRLPSPPKETLRRSHFDGSLATADPARACRLSFGAFFTSRPLLSKYVEETETSDNRQAQRPATEKRIAMVERRTTNFRNPGW